jgi:hypothetical protein
MLHDTLNVARTQPNCRADDSLNVIMVRKSHQPLQVLVKIGQTNEYLSSQTLENKSSKHVVANSTS